MRDCSGSRAGSRRKKMWPYGRICFWYGGLLFAVRIICSLIFWQIDPHDQVVEFQCGGVYHFACHLHDHLDADISGRIVDGGNRRHLLDRIEDMAVVADS